MILFDKAEIFAHIDSIVIKRHKRIKLFKDYDKDIANIRLSYYSYHGFEAISLIEAHTIRLENNKIIITPIEPKLIYNQVVDKNQKAIIFTFQDVQPGCIIEYSYKWKSISPANFPTWFFQNRIPTRYSELNVSVSSNLSYNKLNKGQQKFNIDTNEVIEFEKGEKGRKFYWAKSNLHSFVTEPFVAPGNMNFQYVMFQLRSVNFSGSYTQYASNDTWFKISRTLALDDDFGGQLNANLANQDTLLEHVSAFNTNDDKIAYLFDAVKKNMKWTGDDRWYTDAGVHKAWNKKLGNSTEINLILYNLLTKAHIKAFPMAVSTRDNGTISPHYASLGQINKAVVYIPVDSTKYYVLDASNKYNVYNNVPIELLNTYGVSIEKTWPLINCHLIFLKNELPAQQIIFVSGEIKPDSKVSGVATISNYSYIRASHQEQYDKVGESKYTDILRGDDNKIRITELGFENMKTDTLPLIEKFNFNVDMASSDDKYIYFKPNLFSSFKSNPFLSEQRQSDIDFGNCSTYNILGRYKLPVNYTIESVPLGTILRTEDKSIIFTRNTNIENGFFQVKYKISFTRSIFKAEEYIALRDFYKKMFELLNEPIVLKRYN